MPTDNPEQEPTQELSTRLGYDFQIVEGNDDAPVVISPDEAWEIAFFLSGERLGSPYKELCEEVSHKYNQGYPTDKAIPITEHNVLALAGTYIGMLHEADLADATRLNTLRYKIDRLLEILPEDQQEALSQELS